MAIEAIVDEDGKRWMRLIGVPHFEDTLFTPELDFSLPEPYDTSRFIYYFVYAANRSLRVQSARETVLFAKEGEGVNEIDRPQATRTAALCFVNRGQLYTMFDDAVIYDKIIEAEREISQLDAQFTEYRHPQDILNSKRNIDHILAQPSTQFNGYPSLREVYAGNRMGRDVMIRRKEIVSILAQQMGLNLSMHPRESDVQRIYEEAARNGLIIPVPPEGRLKIKTDSVDSNEENPGMNALKGILGDGAIPYLDDIRSNPLHKGEACIEFFPPPQHFKPQLATPTDIYNSYKQNLKKLQGDGLLRFVAVGVSPPKPDDAYYTSSIMAYCPLTLNDVTSRAVRNSPPFRQG